MGQDGLAGCRVVKAAGGIVMAQVAAGCALFGIPKAVTEAGLADIVVPQESIAAAIMACAQGKAVR